MAMKLPKETYIKDVWYHFDNVFETGGEEEVSSKLKEFLEDLEIVSCSGLRRFC
jgi:hypothetical protein